LNNYWWQAILKGGGDTDFTFSRLDQVLENVLGEYRVDHKKFNSVLL